MAENGILDYQGMNQAIYRGATSNIVVDTQSMSIEIGAGNSSHTSNLHIECDHDANVASIQLNSNVVTEFSRSKKLIKYPRVAMTANTTGGYLAEASSEETSSSRYAWSAFNNTFAESNGWRHETSGGNRYNTSGSDGNYIGTFVNFSTGSAQTFTAADQGEWIKIRLPANEKMQLKGFTLQPRFSNSTGGNSVSYGRSEFIKNGTIWGSNDGSSWDRVYTIKGAEVREEKYTLSFNDVNSITAYRYFVLVITNNRGGPNAGHTSLSEWQLFGVPEYDPDAHGTNMTIKSVANVPNTDWLEVYYDAKNYTNGSVQDETANNRNATLDGVVHDSVSKSFTFDGGNDKIHMGPFSNFTPTSSYTASVWFKVPEVSSGEDILFHFGHGSGGESFGMNVDNGKLGVFIWDGTTVKTRADIFTANEWVHTTCIANSDGTVEIYFNGRLVSFGGTGQALTIPTNPYLSLGIHFSGEQTSFQTGGFFKGSIANFRLFNRPLNPGEIYQLYVYQKEEFGHGDLSMTLKSGRLGIGTYEPQTELDVRGEVKSEIQTVIQSESLDDNSTGSTPQGRGRSRRDIQGSMFVSKYFKASAGAWKAGWPVPNGANSNSQESSARGEKTREQLVLTFEGDEGAFLAMGGEGMTFSNPGDHGALSYFDEDTAGSSWNGSWTSSTGRPSAGWHITAGGSLQSGSDIRLKENIEEYNPENILDKIKNVELITFTMKPPRQEIAYKRKYTERQAGVSAQNIQTLFPEYIDDQGDFLKMNYTRWPIANTAAIKELIKIIENQQNTINNLLERVSTLENQ